MLKVTSSLVLLSSVSANSSLSAHSLASAKQEALKKQNFLNYGKGMRAFADRGLPPAVITTATAGASSNKLNSAAAVAGNWVTSTTGAGGSCDAASNSVAQGYLMSFCAEDVQIGKPSTFSMYTCTHDEQDDAANQFVLRETTYTDSACTAGASVQPNKVYSTICDGFGTSVACSATNAYKETSTDFSDGLVVSGYGNLAECNAGLESDLVTYGGVQGCVEGVYWGSDSLSVYLTADCTGAAFLSSSYSSALPSDCAPPDEDGDDDSALIYDNSFLTFTYGADSDDDVCFHVDSKIDYKGVEYTYDELKAGKEPECSVPHSPSSKGVVISTSCDKTVRVTDTHLMATTKGFQLAYSLKAGDVLFGDYDKEMCVVTSVQKEKTAQQYFGLNCVHSEVLASGLRASTFGDFHTLPSWYMTYVGGMIGSGTASSLGEYIAEWYFQKK